MDEMLEPDYQPPYFLKQLENGWWVIERDTGNPVGNSPASRHAATRQARVLNGKASTQHK